MPYYSLGVLALLATNGITVWIPRELEAAVDGLNAMSADAVHGPVVRILIFAALLVVIRTLSRVLFFVPGRAVERDLRNDVFASYLARPMAWYAGRSTGDLMTRATHDILAIRALVGFGFLQVGNMTLLLAMVLSQMIDISPRVTLFAAVPMAAGLLVLRHAIRRLMELMRSSQQRLAVLEQRALDGLKGVRVVRDFGAGALVRRGFDEVNDELLALRLRVTRITSFELPVVRVVGNLSVAILLAWGALLAGQGALSVGQIAAYISYLALLVGALFSAGWMLNALQRGMVSLQRLHEVMPMDDPAPRGPRASDDRADPLPAGVASSLEVCGASVRKGGHLILDGIDLTARPGMHVGLLGTVGSGKTTLTRLLVGAEPADEGTVLLGGRDARELGEDALRSRVRVVPDVPFLFTRRLAENVAFVDTPESIDFARVREALHVAGFDPDAEGLAAGIDTVVGEKGIALSGGQKQRITLARAIYAGGDVLVLDDVLSAVDHRTEHTILERLSAWRTSEGRQVILINISNRVSALADADEVVVLHEGRIVERGTPAELAAGDGLYARTHALQEAVEAEGGVA